MRLFIQKDGIVQMHASDCKTWATWSQGTRSEPDPDIEEIITKAAGCSLVKWQTMTEQEADKRLKKACKVRAQQLKKRRMEAMEQKDEEEPTWEAWRIKQKEEQEREPVPSLPPLKVAELPSNYTWRVPNKQDLLDTQAAWIVHKNQARRKEILERASAKMAEALTTAGSLMAEAIEMLKEL
jgi:hypothetical protein